MSKPFLIAGPCSLTDLEACKKIARELKRLEKEYDVEVIFKGSIKKANRSRVDSFSTIGYENALKILSVIKNTFGFKITTDIHEIVDLKAPGFLDVVDWIQIPAFLCRQTELIQAAAATGKVVTIKKGQFMSPENMLNAVEKAKGAQEVFVIERGTTFGYGDLIVDVRSIPRMKKLGLKVVMDCTHSVQMPNSSAGITGGDPSMIESMVKYGSVMGADGLFIEVYPEPSESKSDAGSILALNELEPILKQAIRIYSSKND